MGEFQRVIYPFIYLCACIHIFIVPQEFTQEFEDESAASLMDLDLFDTSGDYDYEGSADVPDGKIDFDEFKAAARKIPPRHAGLD